MTEQQTLDREKKIAEIREALEKATQGQWKWIDSGGLERKKLVGEWEIMNFGIGGVYDQVAGSEPDEEDAHLIANAPEWLRFLLSELDNLQQAYDDAEMRASDAIAERNDAQQEIERLGNLARQERELANHWMRKHHDDVVKLREEREKMIEEKAQLRAENEALRMALEWYTDASWTDF